MAMLDLKKVLCTSVVSTALVSTSLYAAPQMSKLPTSAWGLNDQHVLFNVNPYQPDVVLKSVPLTGLLGEDKLVGIDYRVARGDLYGLANSGRIYVINTSSGKASLVDGSDVVPEMAVGPYGFDFNPAADKLRVVGNKNRNLRLDPDNGAKVDFDKITPGVQTDPNLVYDSQDLMAGEFPDIVAAAYTYNPNDSKLTTNFAIDRRNGKLLMQGTKEGVTPSVSPNLGVLFTVGDLGTGPLKDASFDISDVSNTAFAAILPVAGQKTVLMEVDLSTGMASKVGALGDGSHVVGFAIEP